MDYETTPLLDKTEKEKKETKLLQINKRRISLGGWLLSYIPPFAQYPKISYQALILVLTFLCYTCYHMNRMSYSGIKSVIGPNCTKKIFSNCTDTETNGTNEANNTNPGWAPFVDSDCGTLLGVVDNSWGIAYAMVMFISGFVAERVDLRYFLTIGMIGSALGSILFGMSQFFGIHSFAYFVIIRIFSGAMQSTGWPSVVPIMGNWFGKKRRGLLMGIWNSHTSVGNMLGLLLAAQWANPDAWEWSFFAPGFIMLTVAMLMFLFLVVDPSHVGLPQPVHHLKSDIRFVKKSIQVPDDDDDKIDDIGDKKTINLTGIIKKMLNLVKTVVIGNNRGAISIVGVLTIPGVIEYSIALFFSKLVAYTFLFWLPYYVASECIGGEKLPSKQSDILSVVFDIGGIFGSFIAGLLSDVINARGITCVLMSFLSVPALFVYKFFGYISLAWTIVLMGLCGALITGPYACITTAVSSDLGTHRSLRGNQKAKATVAAIVDGTGSIGAALGPLLTGWISSSYGWDYVFYLLMGSCFLSGLFLLRLVYVELKGYYIKFTTRGIDTLE